MDTKKIQRIQNAMEQSLIFTILIYPSSFSILSKFLTNPIPKFQLKYFSSSLNVFSSILIKMNPLLIDNINEEENEINTIIQEDNVEQLKMLLINHFLNPNHKDGKEITLIEKCVFFEKKKCINFLLEENISIERQKIKIGFDHYEIGLMEYGSLKGKKDIIKFCLEKSQKIQEITLILGLIGHHNELVEWMIDEGKRRKHFNDMIEKQIFGFGDNIEFNEKLLKKGINTNSEDHQKR